MTAGAETIVLGAGISGLAYAHALGPDADVLVLEAAERPGGLIATARTEAGHFECGPEALQDDAPETLALIGELGLQALPADPAAARRYVLHERHGLLPLPTGPGAFLRSPLLSRRGRLRALSEPWRKAGVALEGSVADFIRHRLGEEVLQRLVDPFVSGIYAGDAERTSLRAAFPTLYAMARDHGSLMGGLKARARARRAAGQPRKGPPSLLSVRGGLAELPQALSRELGERLRTGCPVRSVGRSGDGWRVRTGADELSARRVVLALPAARAAQVLVDELPEVARELAPVHGETVVSVAHAWQRDEVAHPLDGFGYLVPSSLGRRHLGTLFSSAIVPERWHRQQVLLRTLVGGARHPELADLDDHALAALVRQDVAPLLGLPDKAPLHLHVSRWRSVLPRYDLDHPARQERLDAALAARPGLAVLGNHRRGISVNALIEAARGLAREHGAPVPAPA